MNQQHIDLWKQTAEAWDQRLQAVGEQWQADTPCEGWCVEDLEVAEGYATALCYEGPSRPLRGFDR